MIEKVLDETPLRHNSSSRLSGMAKPSGDPAVFEIPPPADSILAVYRFIRQSDDDDNAIAPAGIISYSPTSAAWKFQGIWQKDGLTPCFERDRDRFGREVAHSSGGAANNS
jgi:hypothetical protein